MNLKVTLIQSPLVWEDVDANLAYFTKKINALNEATEVIVLPEMFTTGFSMQPEKLAEKMDGKAMTWLQSQAAQANAVICGSLIIEENGAYYNRFIWMQPDGTFQQYDKRHLFTLAKEHEHYQAGTQKLIIDYKGWKICPMVCYDLRFPVWSRNHENYDLLIYVANWPNKRSHHWKSLLVARAIENQCYTIGVNRMGTDANDLTYSGDSALIDYSGLILQQISTIEGVITATLDKQKQEVFRSKLSFLKDGDDFNINI